VVGRAQYLQHPSVCSRTVVISEHAETTALLRESAEIRKALIPLRSSRIMAGCGKERAARSGARELDGWEAQTLLWLPDQGPRPRYPQSLSNLGRHPLPAAARAAQ
jgi:hypothetical protein